MNRKVLVSMLAIALIVGLVGAATWAYFSDVETSSNNTFTAGTLDLTVDGANDPLPVKFQLGPLAPGESGTIIYELNNVGSLNGWLDIEGVTVLNTEGLNPESETGNTADPGELGANIQINVEFGYGGMSIPKYSGSLDGFVGNPDYSAYIPAGTIVTFEIAWSIDGPSVGNDIQGDIATVGMTFELAQTKAQ